MSEQRNETEIALSVAPPPYNLEKRGDHYCIVDFDGDVFVSIRPGSTTGFNEYTLIGVQKMCEWASKEAECVESELLEEKRIDCAVPPSNIVQLDHYYVPVSFGDLFDKITILEIKRDLIADPAKRDNIGRELSELMEFPLPDDQHLADLRFRLKMKNRRIWDLENTLAQDPDDKLYLSAAKTIRRVNQQRAKIKREINEYLGSALIEEKAYG